MRRLTLAALLLALGVGGARADVTPFTFAHISDTHFALYSAGDKHEANLKAAIAEMNAMATPPAFIVNTGDVTEMGEEAQFARYLAAVAGAKMPVKNTPGNHETRWADQSINRFTRHFGSPNISFKRNGVRFVGFNAAIWLEHHGAVSGDTRRWIVEQLALDAPGTPAVLFAHQPPMYPDNVFTTGDVELWEAIKPYNVRLFINGHGHINKTWTVNGVLCKMVKGMMNDTGAYSLYEVTPAEIRVYDKPVGKDRSLVATVPVKVKGRIVLNPRITPVSGGVDVVASVKPFGIAVDRVEYNVDHHERPDDKFWTRVAPREDGTVAFTVKMAGLAPGRHTLAVRAVDKEGGVWIVSRDLPRTGGALVFDAGTALQGPAAADTDTVYVGGWDGALYAVAKDTMKPRWIYKTGGAIIGRPDTDAATVYFGGTDERIHAVDKRTGRQRWSVKTGGPIQGHTRVANGTVYAASGDHKLYAVNAATGKTRWTYTMGLHAQARPVVWNGTVYIGAWDGKFHAVDEKTGRPKWTRALATSIYYAPAVSSPCLVDGKIITTRSISPSDPEGPHILCLDARTGETVWGHRLATGSAAYASPTVGEGKVYLATLSGDVFALNISDGNLVWKTRMGEIAYDCAPTYSKGQVICNTLLGSVEALDAATGERLWQHKTGAGFTFGWPVVTDGAVYQTSMDGTLTAIPRR